MRAAQVQGELFGPSPGRSRLYSSVDEVNRKFGRGTLFPLAEGVDKKWNARRGMLSKAYTTSWDDIISVNDFWTELEIIIWQFERNIKLGSCARNI